MTYIVARDSRNGWNHLALQLQKSTTRDRLHAAIIDCCSKPHPLCELVLFELVRKGGHVPLVPCTGSATGIMQTIVNCYWCNQELVHKTSIIHLVPEHPIITSNTANL